MAISRLKTDLNRLIDKQAEKAPEFRQLSQKNDFHKITINKNKAAAAFQRGTQRVLLMAGYTRQEVKAYNQAENNINNWKIIFNNLYNSWSGGPTINRGAGPTVISIPFIGAAVTGVYMSPASTAENIIVLLYNVKRGNAQSDITRVGFAKRLRIAMFDEWRAIHGVKVGKLKGNQLQGMGLRTPFVHEAGSEVGSDVFREIEEDMERMNVLPEMEILGIPTVYFDIMQQFKSAVTLNLKEVTTITPDGSSKTSRIIEGNIGGINFPGSEAGDVKRVRSKLNDLLQDYLNKHAKDFGFDEDSGLDYELSKPIRKQLEENAIAGILAGAKKGNRKAKVTGKAKKLKNNQRKASLRKAKPQKLLRGSVQLSTAGKAKRREEKKAAGGAKQLLALQKKINKRLPAEVRRNMGGSALNNISGTFSNSTRLMSLRQTKMGLSGEYTYMRTGGGTPPRSGQPGVYETFEGKGKYANRWPASYNPKPLIAKSIRELAKAYTEQKLVSLRRV